MQVYVSSGGGLFASVIASGQVRDMRDIRTLTPTHVFAERRRREQQQGTKTIDLHLHLRGTVNLPCKDTAHVLRRAQETISGAGLVPGTKEMAKLVPYGEPPALPWARLPHENDAFRLALVRQQSALKALRFEGHDVDYIELPSQLLDRNGDGKVGNEIKDAFDDLLGRAKVGQVYSVNLHCVYLSSAILAA